MHCAAAAASIGLALALCCCPSRIASAQQLAMAVKATYLVKFGGFVEWPPSAFPSAASPLVLCVEGGHPFGGLLDQAAARQAVGRHPIEIRRLPPAAPPVGCQILYASGPSVDATLAAAQGEPVLTVTDLPASASRKGIINFVVRDDRVRFEISGAAAAQAGLRISSQLLTLAVNLHPE